MAEIIMPKMSDAMEEGKVLRWIKHVGDEIQKGEPIAEIETDKANVELEAPESGVLQQISVQEGESAPIGTSIGIISSAGAASIAEEKKEEAPTPPPPPIAEEDEKKPTPPPEPSVQPVQDAGRESPTPKASPLARKIALDAGVELSEVTGTGPGGRIVEADVKRHIERIGKPVLRPEEKDRPAKVEPPAAPVPERRVESAVPIGRIWETVAKRMTESKTTTPHFYVSTSVIMDEALRIRERINSTREPDQKISVNDIVIKAAAMSLAKHDVMNASYEEGYRIKMHDSINIGIAVALPDGLITPVVRDCANKSLSDISSEARDLINRARQGEIRPDEYSGATFSITNLGMYEVDEFQAIIVPPQAAILAVGAAIPQPVVVDDEVKIRKKMRLTVSADHRVVDGARVAEFLRDLKHALEHPMTLLE